MVLIATSKKLVSEDIFVWLIWLTLVHQGWFITFRGEKVQMTDSSNYLCGSSDFEYHYTWVTWLPSRDNCEPFTHNDFNFRNVIKDGNEWNSQEKKIWSVGWIWKFFQEPSVNIDSWSSTLSDPRSSKGSSLSVEFTLLALHRLHRPSNRRWGRRLFD